MAAAMPKRGNGLLLRELAEVLIKARSYFGVGCACRRPPGDQHDIKRSGPTGPVMPEVFAAETLDAVTLNGRAYFLGNN
jgi:hypothetical protein